MASVSKRRLNVVNLCSIIVVFVVLACLLLLVFFQEIFAFYECFADKCLFIKLIEDEKQDNLERGMSEQEAIKAAEEAKKEAVETLKGNIKPAVEEEVIMMKQEYKIAKEALDSIAAEANTAIATAAIPPAISAPPSVANPLYTLAMATQTKKSLLKTINIVIAALTKEMMIANRLKIELPPAIVNLVKVLGTATTALSVIPG
jgi:hypothetical protein